MAWPFDGIKKWFNNKYEEYFIIPENLRIVETLIAKSEAEILYNKDVLKGAITELKLRPDLLPEYLKDFVTKKIDKEDLPAHVVKNIPAEKIDQALLEKYVTTQKAFKKALYEFTKIIQTDDVNPDLEYSMGDLGLALDLKKYPTFLKKMGLTKLEQLVSSNYTHDDLFSDKIDPIKNEIVDHSLSVLRNIIEGDNIVLNHKKEIEAAMETLKLYPEILKTKGMEYLIPFVNGDLENAVTRLSITIGKTIPQETAEELIRTGKFTPLAKEHISFPNGTANNINIMYKGDQSGEQRCVKATKEFLSQNDMTEEVATQATAKLQEDYPLLLSVAALKDIEQKNADSSIVAQREGFDLVLYRQEVAFVKDAKNTLARMAKGEKVTSDLSKLNKQAHKIREYYASIPHDLGSQDGKKILEGEEKKRDAPVQKEEKIAPLPVQKKKSWRLFTSNHKEGKAAIEPPYATPKSESMFNFFGKSNSKSR